MTDRFVAQPTLGALLTEPAVSSASVSLARGSARGPVPSRSRDRASAVSAQDDAGRPMSASRSADPAIPTGTAALADARMVRMRMAAEFGPLAPYLVGANVTDLFVNGESGLWVDRGAGLERDAAWSMAERPLRELAVRLIALGGRHIDESKQ